MKRNTQDLEEIAQLTLEHYNQHAAEFWQGTRDHDVSQNIAALLQPRDDGGLRSAAQLAERKYCRPQARPRLGFPRKLPVFPTCRPAAAL
jgi:hypothetical protein